jgi:membrane-associated protein
VARGPESERSGARGFLTRRYLVGGIVLLAVLLGIAFLLHRLQGDRNFTVAEEHLGAWAYLLIFLLVFGDALFPVFPSETSLLAASTLAVHGALDLGLVIATGAAGSIAGDSTLFWIARRGSRRIGERLEQARRRASIESALDVLGRNGPVLIVAGRYVPGVRFVVNASMGFSGYPYRRFLVWSAVGGALWSTSTCLVAAGVATVLAGFPLASVVLSGALTMGAIAVVFVALRKSRSRSLRRCLTDESEAL